VLYLDGEEEWLELGSETVVFLRAARSTAITAGHFLTSEWLAGARARGGLGCGTGRADGPVCTGRERGMNNRAAPLSLTHTLHTSAPPTNQPSTADDVSKKGGHDAVGWHLAVYWKDDKQFYQGQVADYNPASGKHKVGCFLGASQFECVKLGHTRDAHALGLLQASLALCVPVPHAHAQVVYVDGEVEELHLANERVIWRLPPNEASESGDDADGDAAAAATAKRNRGRGRDSDESDDMMETEEPVTEEPATATDDDASTGGGGGGATGKKRPGGKAGATTIIKRRRRTRRGRGRVSAAAAGL
jgi:hypothetical protein